MATAIVVAAAVFVDVAVAVAIAIDRLVVLPTKIRLRGKAYQGQNSSLVETFVNDLLKCFKQMAKPPRNSYRSGRIINVDLFLLTS